MKYGGLAPVVVIISLGSIAGAFLNPKRPAIDVCLTEFVVNRYEEKSPDYTQAVKAYNWRVPIRPAAYAVPLTTQDVRNAVFCGQTTGLKVTAKGGGHSYGSHGLGGEDGHLVIDMRHFNAVVVDSKAHTATIGAGGRLGNIATTLYGEGAQAISHGTCPGVGIGGLTLGGGYGLTSRSKGLTLDNLLEATVVVADGSVVTASDTENPDLFWALRGAGPAFGVVTEFKFKTFDAPENCIVFKYSVRIESALDLSGILTALQDYTRTSQPPELNMRLLIAPFSIFSGIYLGPREEFDNVMNPLLAKMGIPINFSDIRETSWLDALHAFSAGTEERQPEVYDQHQNFFAKSLMPNWLSPTAIDALSTYWEKHARSNERDWYLLIDSHGGVDSAVSAVSSDSTAYPHRNATFKMQFYDRIFEGEYNPQWQSFLDGWVDAITAADPEVEHGMYVNYVDTSLSAKDAHRLYWLGNYERLLQVKRVWDPENVFGGPQLVGS